MNTIVVSIIILGIIGLIAAILLYAASRKFRVEEDPKISLVEEVLPGANCGGCGYSGCHAFAVACAEASSLDNLHCTSLDAEGMEKIAEITGLKASGALSRKAVIHCKASCGVNDSVNQYDGVTSCAIKAGFYQGESDCIYGCLGGGDCVAACPFGAMSISEGEILPQVNLEKCTGCGKCVAACPRQIISLLHIPADRSLFWVACANRDKGTVAMKECAVSCIGCGKCKRTCTHDAITLNGFLAEIDSDKCVGCGDCKDACPRDSIFSLDNSAACEFTGEDFFNSKSCPTV